MSGAITVRRLQGDNDVAIVSQRQSFLSDGWARDVAAQICALREP